jgi:Lon protease-like protein
MKTGLSITAWSPIEGNDFDRAGRFMPKVTRVRIEAILVDEKSADATLSWQPPHPFIPAGVGQRENRHDPHAARLVSARDAQMKAERERDLAVAERDEQRRLNDQLRALLVVTKGLPERSKAFPAATTRFSWLEVD